MIDTIAAEEITPGQLSEDQSSGELTVGMLTEPIHKSTPTGSVSGDDHTSIHHHDNNKLDDSSNDNVYRFTLAKSWGASVGTLE